MRGVGKKSDEPQYFSNQAVKERLKNSAFDSSKPRSFQTPLAFSQSLRVWRIDSEAKPHNSQDVFKFIPLELRTSRVGML